ncbi:unnamed protein product [Paramecium sonneborni]|uniref:Uncharacterized protein n=1 Tax=Paramecium sonneborni TaxID=65129 RepID=A0A8S1QAR1_9CILI|nr:unnamed protein product [Paramecium sonneborni]
MIKRFQQIQRLFDQTLFEVDFIGIHFLQSKKSNSQRYQKSQYLNYLRWESKIGRYLKWQIIISNQT